MSEFLLVAGSLGVAMLVLAGVSELRDRIVDQGWVAGDSRWRPARWLWKTSTRAYHVRALAIARALHLDGAIVERIRAATDPIARSAARLPSEIRERPDLCFLRRLRPWIYELPAPTNYRGSAYYLDIMGATYQRQPHEPSLEQIFVSWIETLRRASVIGGFDVVLTPKDGNPLLAARVAQAGFKQLVVCKGERDRARVNRPDASAPHETDFEGLRAFLDLSLVSITPTRRFQAIAVDDSCGNGSQLISAVARFNELIQSDANAYPFDAITDAVILFRVLRSGLTNDGFTNANLALHALVAVGDDELREIHASNASKVTKHAARFKAEPFSCSNSTALLRV